MNPRSAFSKSDLLLSHFLRSASRRRRLDVRFGSLADIGELIRDIRFTPESGHAQGHHQLRIGFRTLSMPLVQLMHALTPRFPG